VRWYHRTSGLTPVVGLLRKPVMSIFFILSMALHDRFLWDSG